MRIGSRLRVSVLAIASAVLVLGIVGCSSDDSSDKDKKKTTTTASPTTVPPPPVTVSDEDFEAAAKTAEARIASAGTDTCALLRSFDQATDLPAPANATQTERGVGVVVKLFQATAAAAPPDAADDAAVLSQAALNLQAEGAARLWDPAWLTMAPGPAAISDPAVSTAFRNYQTEGAKVCTEDGADAGSAATIP